VGGCGAGTSGQGSAQLTYNLEGHPVSWKIAPSNPTSSTTATYYYASTTRIAEAVNRDVTYLATTISTAPIWR
jgi:hypothetical protein